VFRDDHEQIARDEQKKDKDDDHEEKGADRNANGPSNLDSLFSYFRKLTRITSDVPLYK